MLAGDGFVGSFCFVSAKGCELLVIPQGGMWIPAVGVRSGGGRCSWRLLGDEDAEVLSVVYIRLHGGSLSLAALPLLVFLVGVCWARRRAVSGSCGASSGRTEESREERSFTFKLKRPLIREDLNVIQYQSQEADNTFITSDGTSPYNSTRKWAVKRHYREDNN